MSKTKEFPVQPVRVHLLCDNDGEEMRFTGISLMSSPPWYPHKCPLCGREENVRQIYPRIDYREIPEANAVSPVSASEPEPDPHPLTKPEPSPEMEKIRRVGENTETGG